MVFAITHSEVDIVDDPRLVGLLPMDAAPHIPLAAPPMADRGRLLLHAPTR